VKKSQPRNVAASVRTRLMNCARERGDEFQLVLTHYGLERFLYRVSRSIHGPTFVLKGALLFSLWTQQTHRPTKDLDLLGCGEPDGERFAQVVREVCAAQVEDDGLIFDPATVHAARMREDQSYEGLRVTCMARLERARIPLQIDIGFGDAITPAALEVEYPTLLDFPAPKLRAYPRETVVAEKYQAIVVLGIANSRMKDFFDLWVLARTFTFTGVSLAAAIRATFARRMTELPSGVPLAWTPSFTEDASKMLQWRGFLRKSRLHAQGIDLTGIGALLQSFLLPPTQAIRVNSAFSQNWPAGGPWH
jgi:predicted nucleotidyltransferase component of viral defense system